MTHSQMFPGFHEGRNYSPLCAPERILSSKEAFGYQTDGVRHKQFQRLVIIFIVLFLKFIFVANLHARIYYSQNSGVINLPSSWNTDQGGGGETPPDFTGTHTWIVQSNHDMTMSYHWTAGGYATVIVDGSITVSDSYTIIIDGSMSVNGSIVNSGIFSGSGSPITATDGIHINDGGQYEHARNGGVLPIASWSTGSHCRITGITDTSPIIPSLTQPFGNFIWDCQSQSIALSLYSQLASVHGNLIIHSTGNSALWLSNNSPADLSVGGNFQQTGGRFHLAYSAQSTMTINGDFALDAGTFYITYDVGHGTMNVHGNLSSSGVLYFTYRPNGSGTVNLDGDCFITGGNVSMSRGNGDGFLNIAGDFIHSSGTISEDPAYPGTGNIIFNGHDLQFITPGGTISNIINFIVLKGSYLQMADAASVLESDGLFLLSEGATLGVTSPDGICLPGSSCGNIQTARRTYSAGANYIYNGPNQQVTGNGLAQNMPATITIDNNAGVVLSTPVTISGLLTVSEGYLDLFEYNFSSGSITGVGDIAGTTGNPVLTIGSDNTGPYSFNGVISNGTANSVSLIKTGSGLLQLAGNNTFTGDMEISGGILELATQNCLSDNCKVVLNGGTLKTGAENGFSETAGILDLEASSSIGFGTGSHSLSFSTSNTEEWNSSALLTISGWTGSAASGGDAGKLFVGGQDGLTAEQLTQVAFYGWGTGAKILTSGEIVPAEDPHLIISSSDPAIEDGTILQNSSNNVVYQFVVAAEDADATITEIRITTIGDYTSGDIQNLKVWFSDDNLFDPGIDLLSGSKVEMLGPGLHIFPDIDGLTIHRGNVRTIFITADLPCEARVGGTITVEDISASDIRILGGIITGETYAGGLLTIGDLMPETVTDPGATTDDSGSTVTWSNPSCHFDEILIVAKSDEPVTETPSGDGSAYSADLSYGTPGTEFDGGFIIYKGTESGQTVTGLTNGTTYFYTFFSRRNSNWSNAVSIFSTATSDSDRNYRTRGSGSWNDINIWEVSGGSLWEGALYPPDQRNNMITIRNGNTVTVQSDLTIDQVSVEPGGQISVAADVILTVADGSDVYDLNIGGHIVNSGTITSSGSILFSDNSGYEHARNGGTIPVATWAVTSDCLISGITDLSPVIQAEAQPFGNFIWNCPSQSHFIDLSGQLTDINGDFIMADVNGRSLRLSDFVPCTLNVDGNYIQTGGRLHIAHSASARMNILGNFTMEAGTFYMTYNLSGGILDVAGDFRSSGYFAFTYEIGNSGTSVLNVHGSCFVDGGRFIMSRSPVEGSGLLNLSGDLTIDGGGVITEESEGAGFGSVVFNGSSRQMFRANGAVTNTIHFTVNEGSFLQMGTDPSQITGDGNFTLSSGSTLGITSPYGITSTGILINSGNIAVTGLRHFDPGASYIYNGNGNQLTGSGLPAQVAELYLGNSTILTLSNESLNVSSNLTIEPGAEMNIGAGQEVEVNTFNNGGGVNVESIDVSNSGSFFVRDGLTQSPDSYVSYKRKLRSDELLGDWHYIASPIGTLSTQDFIDDNEGQITPFGTFYEIWEWDEESLTDSWGMLDNTDIFQSGKGYNFNLSEGSDGYLFFKGKVVNNVTVFATSPYANYNGNPRATSFDYGLNNPDPLIWAPGRSWTDYGGGGWNLMGNPFTSSLDVKAFILENAGKFDPNYQALYVYDGVEGNYKYAAEEIPGPIYKESGFFDENLQVGQGFFVLALYNNAEFNFKPAMQIHNTSVSLLKSKDTQDPWPGLRLIARGGDLETAATVVFNERMTIGLDPGYDVGYLSNGAKLELYTTLVQNGSANFARQALPTSDLSSHAVSIGIVAAQGSDIVFSAQTIPLKGNRFWLEDRVTGIWTDISRDEYKINLNQALNGTGRFFLHFSPGIRRELRPADETNGNPNIKVWVSSDRELIISGPVTVPAKVEVYDILGNKLLERNLTGEAYNTIALQALTDGVYLVNVFDGDVWIVRKIVL